MPLSRMKKPTFVKPHIQVLSRHGIEDCVTVRMPKRKRLFNDMASDDQVILALGFAAKGCFFRDNLVASHFKYDFWHRTATAGSDVVQSGRPIFDDFFQHLWPYIGNNTANVVFQMVKRLWLIRIDQ
ncbi:adhesion G protein-coupled receptor B2 [Trichonephila clavipes]|nr:adhesion G protein-coupled receptor B2 [Trichonephila clavipes]